jgi:SAM-dependent methyltransferase
MTEDDWKPTLQSINELASQVEFAGLVRGAIASGFLARCREPTTAAELARATDLEPGIVVEVCAALRSFGVLADRADGQVVISDHYAPLLEGGLDQRALDRLTAAGVRAAMVRDLFRQQPSSYWSLDSASRVALALNATGNPQTEFGRESLVSSVRANPEWDAIFTRGGRFLDLGCGVGGAIASFLDAYPRLTAVGIDVAEDVLEVAWARAEALGVADRATFLSADAGSFRDPEPFDVIFWPHTFYPEPSRAAALASIFANLRPGGLLVTVLVPPRPDTGAGRTIEPLLRSLWGIKERSFDTLRSELEDAGFVDVATAQARSIVLPPVTAHRPG